MLHGHLPQALSRGESSFDRLPEQVEEGDQFFDAATDPADAPEPIVCTLEEVMYQEARWVGARREASTARHGDDSIALCLSAGGIRSAACSLGVIWKMASLGCLRKVDYLSTVSGGGYTGLSYATHLLAELESPPADEAGSDAWHRRVVASVVTRMQRNCGYVMTFGQPACAVPTDGSSAVPRGACDVALFTLVLSLVLVSPLFELAKFAIPSAAYVDFLHGEQLRQVFCIQALCSEYVYTTVMQLKLLGPRVPGAFNVSVSPPPHSEWLERVFDDYNSTCRTFEDTADIEDLPGVFITPWLQITLPLGVVYFVLQRACKRLPWSGRVCRGAGSNGGGSSGGAVSGAGPGGGDGSGAGAGEGSRSLGMTLSSLNNHHSLSSMGESSCADAAEPPPLAWRRTMILGHHSVTKLVRAFMVISILLNLLLLAIFVMQQLDWRLWLWTDLGDNGRSFRGSWRPSLCACLERLPNSTSLCSSRTFASHERWEAHADLVNLVDRALEAQGESLVQACAAVTAVEEMQHIAGTPRSTWYFLVTCGVLLLLALLFGAFTPGSRPASAVMSGVLPAAMLWVTASVCQWKVYGPITGQHLGVLPANRTPYDLQAWRTILFSLVGLHMAFVLFYKRLAGAVSWYYRCCLTRAFYASGRDVPLVDFAKRPVAVPVVICGCTLNEYMRPTDTERSSAFAFTSTRMGCARTGYVRCPEGWTAGQTMGISGAAIDAVVLTSNSSFLNRLYLRITAAYLGGWVPYDDHTPPTMPGTNGSPSRIPVSARLPQSVESSAGSTLHAGRVVGRSPVRGLVGDGPLATWGPSPLDSWPGMVGVFLWLASFVVATVYDRDEMTAEHTSCDLFDGWLTAGLVLIAILFSVCFFGFTGCARVLLCMPVLRSMTSIFKVHYDWRPPPYLRLSDGGLFDKLGLVECLRRRIRWIVVSDNGTDTHRPTLRDLTTAIATAKRELRCTFSVARDETINVDDEMELYRRRRVSYLHLRVRYPGRFGGRHASSDVFHIRMRLPRADECAVQPLIAEDEIVNNCPLDPRVARGKNRSELGGLCCECCVGSTLGRLMTGRFPNFITGNQFFTPTIFANVCRLGFELADEPIRQLMQRMAQEGGGHM